MTLCQKDMASGVDELYPCPYCTREAYRGKIGRTNLIKHVQDIHPEKFKEFMEKNIEAYNMTKKSKDEKRGSKPKTDTSDTVIVPKTDDKEKTPEEAPPEDETPKSDTPPSETVEVPEFGMRPTYQIEEPAKWIETFLNSYKFKGMFVRIQVEQVKMTNELPYAGTLMQDMQTMDSGVTNRPTITYIIQNYERQVKQYLQRYEELMDTMTSRRGGYPMQQQGGGYRDTYPDNYNYGNERRGMSVGRDQQMRQQPTYYGNDRVTRLEDEIRKRDEEARRKMEYEYNNMKMKIEQGLTKQEDPTLVRLQQQLETQAADAKRQSDAQAAETRRLTAELAAQKEGTLMERIARIEQTSGGPSAEQIQRYIDSAIQSEHDKVTAADLDRKIKDAINASTGTSKLDVDMKKIDKDYEIAQKKLEVESSKGNMWGETLKDVAGIFGEGLGKGMSGAGIAGEPGQTGQPGQAPVPCPHCGTQLQLPPGVKFGICPKCNGKIEISPSGVPTPFAEQQPLEQQPPNPPFQQPPNPPFNPELEQQPPNPPPLERIKPKKPKADRLGLCPVCGQPVYDDNIGKTENGKPFHKQCC